MADDVVYCSSFTLLPSLLQIPAALSATFAFGFSTYLFGKALSDFQNSGVPNTGFG